MFFFLTSTVIYSGDFFFEEFYRAHKVLDFITIYLHSRLLNVVIIQRSNNNHERS